jgi:hypothetical protein
VPGFTQPGQANNDDLFDEEGFDKTDGIRYSFSVDSVNREETTVVVTTAPILRAWLRRQTGMNPALPIDVAFARHHYLVSAAFNPGSAAVPYAQIPRDTLRALGLSWAWIGNFEQDDHPDPARHALFMVERGRQVVLVNLEIAHPIDPSQNCLDAGKPHHEGEMNHGDDFRACYGREVVHDPRFSAIVAQIREMVDRIRRQ